MSASNYIFNDLKPDFGKLPMEIILEIFSHLQPIDRAAAGQTCHHFLEATQHPQFLTQMTLCFEKIHFNDDCIPISDFHNSFRDFANIACIQVDFCEANKFWSRFGSAINEITFKLCDIREKVFNSILKQLINLRTLRIEGCRELFMSGRLFENKSDQELLKKNLVNLQELSLAHNRYLSDALFNRVVAIAPNLEILDLSGCHISFHKGLYRKFYPASQLEASESVLTFHYISQFIRHNARNIKRLNFSQTLIDGAALITLSEIDGLQLDTINLKSCDQLTNVGIIQLVQVQVSLQHLELSLSVRLTDQCIISICDNLYNLKSLKLRRCRAITDLGVKDIVKLQKLEVLDISECEAITGQSIMNGIASKENTVLREFYVSALNLCEDTIIKIAENFPNLLVLDLSYCFNSVTDLCLQIIFKNLTSLRQLNLDFCDKISDASMTGMSMSDEMDDFFRKKMSTEEDGTIQKQDIIERQQEQIENAEQQNEAMRRLQQYDEERFRQPLKISLRSKAEQEIVMDAQRKQAMLEMCEKNLLDEKKSSGFSIARLKGLRSLKLSGCNKISDVSLKYSFKLKELRELSLARCQQISIVGIQALVLNCPSIESMDLTECHNISDKSVELITIHLKRLSHLSVERCQQLTDYSLDYIAVNCKSLKSLDVLGCRNMSSEPNLRLANLTTLRDIRKSKPGPYLQDYSVNKPKPPPFP